MFTLNGGHVWPFYEAARDQGVRIVDTRHEQTATFAAEAYAKLTRSPGLAVLTAGPGITNGDLGHHDRVVQRLAGRRPRRAGAAGSLGRRLAAGARPRADRRLRHQACGDRHRRVEGRAGRARGGRAGHDPAPRAGVPRLPARRVRDGRRRAARRREPDERGARPRGRRGRRRADRRGRAAGLHRRERRLLGRRVGRAGCGREGGCGFLATSTASVAAACPPTTSWPSSGRGACSRQEADLVVVIGAPLDFRLGFGRFGDGSGRPRRRLRQPAGGARRGHDRRRRPGRHPDRAGRPRRRSDRPRALDRAPPRRRDDRRGAGPGAVRGRRQPDPAGAHLRRAEPAPRARRGGHLRRR